MPQALLTACMLGLSAACLLLSLAHNLLIGSQEVYVVVEARTMLQNGVINTAQFNDTYARPNGASSISRLPAADFSARDAETFLRPIPWKTSRTFLHGITLFTAILTVLSIAQLVIATRSRPRTDQA